jgi:hypothetical protein
MSALEVNIPESLRLRAEALASDDGIALDQFIATALAEKVAVLDAESYIRERAVRGSREKFERVLAKVPDLEPESGDRPSVFRRRLSPPTRGWNVLTDHPNDRPSGWRRVAPDHRRAMLSVSRFGLEWLDQNPRNKKPRRRG